MCDKNQIHHEIHRTVRLTLLYQLMVIEAKDETKLAEYKSKLESNVKELEKVPEDYVKSETLKGFEYIIYLLMGRFSRFQADKFSAFYGQIKSQTKNKEILKKIDMLSKAFENNQPKKLLLFTEIAGFLIIDLDARILYSKYRGGGLLGCLKGKKK